MELNQASFFQNILVPFLEPALQIRYDDPKKARVFEMGRCQWGCSGKCSSCKGSCVNYCGNAPCQQGCYWYCESCTGSCFKRCTQNMNRL